MAREDLASVRAINTSVVLYPCDPNQTAKLTRVMADTPGIVYMRTTRGAYPTIYGPAETFKVGGSKVVRQTLTLKVDRKSTRLNSSHQIISYAVFCLQKKKTGSGFGAA